MLRKLLYKDTQRKVYGINASRQSQSFRGVKKVLKNEQWFMSGDEHPGQESVNANLNIKGFP